MSVGFCRFVTRARVHVQMDCPMRNPLASKRLDRRVVAIAAKQHGVFSFAQVVAAGGNPSAIHHRISTGRWVRAARGAYAFAGITLPFPARVMAACLSAGDWSFASHGTAAELWIPTGGYGGLHVWSPRRVTTGGIKAHIGRLEKADVTLLGPIPITRPERTIIDLSATISSEQLEGMLDEFLRRNLVQLGRIKKRLESVGGSGRRGVRLLQSLISQRLGEGISESELETRLLRALRKEGLPLPVRQFEIRDDDRFVGRVDFAYPEARLLIEAYGRDHHSTWKDLEHDLARQNEIIALGWRVIVVTWSRLHAERAALMRTIARALAA